jgi:hypothetical protein
MPSNDKNRETSPAQKSTSDELDSGSLDKVTGGMKPTGVKPTGVKGTMSADPCEGGE